MKELNYVGPILVSTFFILLLSVFYLYRSENHILMRFLSYLYVKDRYRRVELQQDTRKQDAVLFIVLIILVLMLGVRIIYFQAVLSDSMKPVFEKGDIILSQTVSIDPKIGDIVTFKPKDVRNVVTHRVVDIKGDTVLTKGDNNPFNDDYKVTKKDIVAKVVTIKNQSIVIKGVGSYFILDFSKEGAVTKYGGKFDFLQQMFSVIRTWGYVITAIALIALIMMMMGKRS